MCPGGIITPCQYLLFISHVFRLSLRCVNACTQSIKSISIPSQKEASKNTSQHIAGKRQAAHASKINIIRVEWETMRFPLQLWSCYCLRWRTGDLRREKASKSEDVVLLLHGYSLQLLILGPFLVVKFGVVENKSVALHADGFSVVTIAFPFVVGAGALSLFSCAISSSLTLLSFCKVLMYSIASSTVLALLLLC